MPRRARDELLRLGRDLVGVDLVAEQQERVGPLRARLVAHPLDEREQRVDLAPARVVVLAAATYGVVCGTETRQEPKASRSDSSCVWVRMTHGGYGVVGRRPAPLAVEVDFVGQRAAGLEVLEHHERVVMAGDLEGRRDAAEDARPRTRASVSTQTVASVSET